jgi:replication factor C small subunit
MAKKENTLWAEKYRPHTLEDYVGNDHVKQKVEQYIKDNDPPHLLFYGKAGTGKTTLAKIISDNTNSDAIYINASDETGVDVVRVKIKPFASSVSFTPLKLVILDEFDYMTPNAQAYLRNVMEQFSRNTRFILTCNYHEKIIYPIQSRCQIFEVIPPSRADVAVRVASILQKENITFNPEDIKVLVDSTYPDIRQLINSSQLNSANGELAVDRHKIIESDFRLKLLEILKEKDKRAIFSNIRQLVNDNHVKEFSEVYRFLYDHIDEFAPNNVANSILTIADGIKSDPFVVDKEINFMDMLIKLISIKDES